MTSTDFFIILFLISFVVLCVVSGCVVYVALLSFVIKPKTKDIAFAELLLILNTTIDTEIQSYENSIFQQRGNITNANYENFYKDITSHILSSLPDNFFRSMSAYMTKEAVISLICRRVHNYLQDKVYKEG